ncbi:MAG: Na+/H+ antiporter NhaA [Alphaproteobacteria bacterium]|nr:Na+/H+ antiporter NhaA [Alphaproteobacteria bacterium]
MLLGPYQAARAFFATEAAGGIILIAASLAAMGLANSPLSEDYFGLIHHKFGPLSLGHWINDALMALFFLLVGLEVKREFLEGELSTWQERRLPGLAALCGVLVPAAIYVGLNQASPAALAGWAIPTATDIAFALAILALLGKRVPASLKVLLTAIAVIDDLVAVLIIALFYTSDIALLPLAGAFAVLGLMFLLNRMGRASLASHLALGVLVWFGIFASGVHATLAGVLVALVIPRLPMGSADPREPTMLHTLEHHLHPWVAWLVVPLFGFANAGVSLSGVELSGDTLQVAFGIGLALVLGKQIGIFGAIRLACAIGWAPRPRGASWLQLYGLSALCGIGFTMSLFIGLLAFGEGSDFGDATKIGILAGSLVSAFFGFLVLRLAPGATRSP